MRTCSGPVLLRSRGASCGRNSRGTTKARRCLRQIQPSWSWGSRPNLRARRDVRRKFGQRQPKGQRSDFCKPAAAGAANRETAGAARPVKPANRYQPARIRPPSLVRIRFFFVRSALQGVLKHNRTAKERGTACPTAAPRFSFIFSSVLTVFLTRAGGRPER